MKFLHTGDLHLGKTVNDFSMIEDQNYILDQICEIAEKEKVDALLLAGDIYDRALPPAEAVVLLDSFLNRMQQMGITVFAISGNHDSAERIAFLEQIVEKQGIYLAGVFSQEPKIVRIQREKEEAAVVLLPFFKPAQAGESTGMEAVKKVIAPVLEKQEEERQEGKEVPYVLVTHFFVTDGGWEPELSDAETTVHVGGIDNVDASLFSSFAYVALGHIHKPQQVGKGQIWYSGAPLAYSFSETNHEKSVQIVEISAQGEVIVTKRILKPLHPVRKIRGSLEELTDISHLGEPGSQDYIQAVLTDERELVNPMAALRSVYPNVMQIVMAAHEKKISQTQPSFSQGKRKDTYTLFSEFYQTVSGQEMDGEEAEKMREIIREEEGKA